MDNINQAENIYQRLLNLEKTSRIVKTAHFNSAQKKQKLHKILGVIIILINVLIFSPLINLVFSNNPNNSVVAIKILAIISASLAGVQTLFNSQKEAETHLSAGESYSNVCHKARTLLAKYEDKITILEKFIEEFDSLEDKYLEANKTYKSCIPSDNDYNKAKEKISAREN